MNRLIVQASKIQIAHGVITRIQKKINKRTTKDFLNITNNILLTNFVFLNWQTQIDYIPIPIPGSSCY